MGPRRLLGTVVGFDEAVGLGDIEADEADGRGGPGEAGEASEAGDAGRRTGRFQFHCTQIADGTRSVAVGTRVNFGLLAGRTGRWEAGDIRPAAE
jgi:CspA family cold shock protein